MQPRVLTPVFKKNHTLCKRFSFFSSWYRWETGVESFSAKAAAAFRAEINLHDSTEEIRELWETYFALKEEYNSEIN